MCARGVRLVLILVGIALGSCKREVDPHARVARRVEPKAAAVSTRGESLPKDWKLQGGTFRLRFAIYSQEKPPLDLERELAAAVNGTGLSVVGRRPRLEPAPSTTSVALSQPDMASLFWRLPDIDDFAPPRPESMKSRAGDLSAEEQQRLLERHFVVVLDVVGPAERARADYRQALVLGRTLTTRLGGIPWDDETRCAHTLEGLSTLIDSWQGDVPDVTKHVNIISYRDGELIRLVSLGMVKFGLPDLAVSQVSDGHVRPVGNLMNLAMQRMVERRALDEAGLLRLSLDDVGHAAFKEWIGSDVLPNAVRKLDVTLVRIEPSAVDADNRLLELSFPGEGSAQERQNRAVTTLFGSSDSITTIEHDAALLELSARARKTAFGLRARYAKAPPPGESLLVKAPFRHAGGREWMWVEVVSWQGDVITGILANDPFEIPTLKAGARVEVPADDIFDYILRKGDGTEVGNETGKLIEARERGR